MLGSKETHQLQVCACVRACVCACVRVCVCVHASVWEGMWEVGCSGVVLSGNVSKSRCTYCVQ